MALDFIIRCDYACCRQEYNVIFDRKDETYGDVLDAISTKFGWRIELDGLRVTKAFCPEHSK